MISLILLAGGKGDRFGSNKCFSSLNGKKVIQYSLDKLEPLVDQVIIVSARPYNDYEIAPPGETRSQSVRNGLELVKGNKVIIHDGARPYLPDMSEFMNRLEMYDSVDTAVPIIDGLLKNLVPESKNGYALSQTPEGFTTEKLREAFKKGGDFQDEVSMMWSNLGILPDVVRGVQVNSKITFPNDIGHMEGILKFDQAPIQTTPDLRGKEVVIYGMGTIGSAVAEEVKKRGGIPVKGNVENINTKAKYHVYSAGAYKEIDDIMEANFKIPLILMNVLRGNLVLLSSTAGTYGRKQVMYSASKAALNSAIESKHEEMSKKGLLINAIAPAKVKGKLQEYFDPKADQSGYLDPKDVAEWVVRYLDTNVHGHIIYLRNK